MSNYASRGRAPRTLTDAELAKVLRVSGERRATFRDHVIISLAVGAGLREHEIAALDVGDVVDDKGRVRRRVALRKFKGSARTGGTQEVILTDECRRKLALWLEVHDWQPAGTLHGDVKLAWVPLFLSRQGRISTRRIRSMWRAVQLAAGLERLLPFHALRHTFGTNAYRAGRDVLAAQRLLRHRRVETTQVYAHVSDAELEKLASRLPS